MQKKHLLKFLGVIAAMIVFFTLLGLSDFLDALPPVFIVFPACALLLMLYFCWIRPWLKRKQQEKQQRIRQASLIPEESADSKILYLRPFHVDNTAIPPTDYNGKTYHTIEALLCAFMSKYGMPIAIGKPQEKLQPLGAARTYASNNDWKNVVKNYLEESQFVILYVEFTDGVKWEINEVLHHYLDKLILVPKMYHRQGVRWEKATLFLDGLTFFVYPLVKFIHRNLRFRKIRRGKAYYKTWDQEMSDVLPPGFIDDRTAALIFRQGKPVPYLIDEATLEKQFTAIASAVRDKMKEDE